MIEEEMEIDLGTAVVSNNETPEEHAKVYCMVSA